MKKNKSGKNKIPVWPENVCTHVLPLQSFKVVSLEPKLGEKKNEHNKFILKTIAGSKHLISILPIVEKKKKNHFGDQPSAEFIIPVKSSPEGSFITAWIAAL